VIAQWRIVLLGAVVLAASFAGTLWLMDWLWPEHDATAERPPLADTPPLPPVTRSSVIVAPVAIANTAIRDILEAAAPRDFSGKRDNPLSQALSKADIGFSLARTPISVAGKWDALVVGTELNGSFRIAGQLGAQAANLTGALGGIVNSTLGRNAQSATGKMLDQRADIRGSVLVNAKPVLQQNWRIEPNLSAQVSIPDGGIAISGVKLNVSNEVKPMVDRAVNEQIIALQSRLRADPFIEVAAKREWAKMCRSVPLGGAGTGLPALWLEMRPTRAFAAQPRIDENNVVLTLGVQADTRIVPNESKPSCPFPQRLEIVPPIPDGRVTIGVPIDLPFAEVNKILDAQLRGKTFPEDGSGAVEVTVLRASLAASGERLLLSLRVKGRERKSWFGFGTEATLHVFGKPALEREQQILQLRDISLAVESDAAFGLIGAAAQSALPYLRATLERNATIDLKPFAANARQKIEAALADFRQAADGVRVEAAMTSLRLSDIQFDARTLRIVAEASGSARATLSKLTLQ
jgi:hypothetical protein